MSDERTDRPAAAGVAWLENGRPKIVIVDDEPAMCALVEGMLAEAGYATAATADSRTAVALIRHEHPALVLADISMPHMDGYALMAALQSDPATSMCPVIFITGHLGFSERIQAFRHGARDYLAKPFTSDKLLAKVARALNDRGPRASP